MFIYTVELGTRFWLIVISLSACVAVLGAICVGLVQNWIERAHGRKWPTASAVIDIVSVAFVPDDTQSIKSYPDLSCYQATLTYTYKYPEQQIGEYSRRFGNEDDAKAWANSYKGETVKVHVDARDPTRSILREEDL